VTESECSLFPPSDILYNNIRVAQEVGRHGLLALFEHDLEVPQHVLLDALPGDEGDRIALLAGAARAADAVRVRLDVLRVGMS